MLPHAGRYLSSDVFSLCQAKVMKVFRLPRKSRITRRLLTSLLPTENRPGSGRYPSKVRNLVLWAVRAQSHPATDGCIGAPIVCQDIARRLQTPNCLRSSIHIRKFVITTDHGSSPLRPSRRFRANDSFLSVNFLFETHIFQVREIVERSSSWLPRKQAFFGG
jgi:hypothetical protein